MGLRIYLDPECTKEIADANPDSIRKAVVFNATMTDEISLYVKSDDPTLAYENVSITALNDDIQLDAKYALDESGTPGEYQDALKLPSGLYDPPVRIWRKVTAPDVTAAFRRTDVKHSLVWDEYVI